MKLSKLRLQWFQAAEKHSLWKTCLLRPLNKLIVTSSHRNWKRGYRTNNMFFFSETYWKIMKRNIWKLQATSLFIHSICHSLRVLGRGAAKITLKIPQGIGMIPGIRTHGQQVGTISWSSCKFIDYISWSSCKLMYRTWNRCVFFQDQTVSNGEFSILLR